MLRCLRFYSSKPQIRRQPDNIFLKDSPKQKRTKRNNYAKEHAKWLTETINYASTDSIVFFSASRAKFSRIGIEYFNDDDNYARIMGVANEVYGDYVFTKHDFRARSVQNLALNLCCYRRLFGEHPDHYRTIKAAVGYGIGEVAAAVVAGIIKMEDAFWIVNKFGHLVQDTERNSPSALAMLFTKKQSTVHHACLDARRHLESSYGFEYADSIERPIMVDPRTKMATTVTIASAYCANRTLVGGNPDGVKFLLTNMKHHGIRHGFILKGQPALNTAHFSHVYDSLTRLTESMAAEDGNISVYNACSVPGEGFTFGTQHNSVDYIKSYTSKTALDNIVRALTCDPIGWLQLSNRLLIKRHESNERKMDHAQMPHVIDLGTGGVHAAQLRLNLGPGYFEADKYKWIGTGEEEWYRNNHLRIRTRFQKGREDLNFDCPFTELNKR